VWKISKRKWTSYWDERRERRMREMAERLRSHIPRGLVRLYTLCWIVFTVGIVVVVAYGFAHPFGYPIEIHHEVTITRQIPGLDRTWELNSDEDAKHRLTGFWFNCCPETKFDCSQYIRAGYIAKTVKFEVREGCFSIRGTGLAFEYHGPGETFWTRADHTKEYPNGGTAR
jgi:hypothetical protein